MSHVLVLRGRGLLRASGQGWEGTFVVAACPPCSCRRAGVVSAALRTPVPAVRPEGLGGLSLGGPSDPDTSRQ